MFIIIISCMFIATILLLILFLYIFYNTDTLCLYVRGRCTFQFFCLSTKG